jgi:radical SAM protein with 4Fe4S-binding SPASM domain
VFSLKIELNLHKFSINLILIDFLMYKTIFDTFNLLSKLSLKRLWNALMVVYSYIISKITGNPIPMGLPISISFEPTTSCNLRCPECPSGLRSFTRPTGMLQVDLFKQTIDSLADTLLYLIFYFQGEPYLNPHFLDLVKYAAKKKIYTATSTNAHYLNDENAKKTVESGLDRLIISIDGTSQETYEAYRVGGNLEKVIEGTKNILNWKKELKSATPFVIFQFLVVRPNEHQIEEVKKLGKELGVDAVWCKTAQIYDYENGSDLIPTIEKYSRYRSINNSTLAPNEVTKYEIKNKMLNHCWKMWHSCVITWDGLVVPCCFDKDAEYRMGSLKTKSFAEVWQSDTYTNFRKSLISSRSEIEMCKNCSEGTRVWG